MRTGDDCRKGIVLCQIVRASSPRRLLKTVAEAQSRRVKVDSFEQHKSGGLGYAAHLVELHDIFMACKTTASDCKEVVKP